MFVYHLWLGWLGILRGGGRLGGGCGGGGWVLRGRARGRSLGLVAWVVIGIVMDDYYKVS